MTKYLLLASFCVLIPALLSGQAPWGVEDGLIRFRSDAPLELIQAASQKMRGVIDTRNRTFAFSVPIVSFQGFNSSLQREHFKENYLESDQYPDATFNGRIIDDVDLSEPGAYSVRAKGMLVIHGVSQERIIRSEVVVTSGGECTVNARFTVLLADHAITIPKVVYQKIAEEIEVEVAAVFRLK